MTNEVNQALEFEKRLSGLKDRELLEFVARQNYETCIRCESHNQRITTLENGTKRISGITGGITGTITGIVVGVISYFVGNK